MKMTHAHDGLLCIRTICDRCGKEVHDTTDYRYEIDRRYYILKIEANEASTECPASESNFAPGTLSCVLCAECAVDAIKRALAIKEDTTTI